MTRLPWLAGAAVASLAAVAMLATIGGRRWSIATSALVGRLEASRLSVGAARYDSARELPGLPPPVQRFFRASLAEGTPIVAAVRLEHRGQFNLAAQGPDRWIAFSSTQRVTTRRPGFVWDANMAMAPGIAVRVHDAYVAGEGLLHAALLGLITLADLQGAGAEPGGLAHGEFMRFAAEAVWYPTALLPSQGASWAAIDDRSARVTLSDGAVSVSLLMRFDPRTGLIDSVRADARGRLVGKDMVMTPWEGRWWDHAEHGGMKVPMRGEVAWLTEEGQRPYWRGGVTALCHEFVR